LVTFYGLSSSGPSLAITLEPGQVPGSLVVAS